MVTSPPWIVYLLFLRINKVFIQKKKWKNVICVYIVIMVVIIIIIKLIFNFTTKIFTNLLNNECVFAIKLCCKEFKFINDISSVKLPINTLQYQYAPTDLYKRENCIVALEIFHYYTHLSSNLK